MTRFKRYPQEYSVDEKLATLCGLLGTSLSLIDLLVLRGSGGRWIFLVLPSTIFLFFFIMRSIPSDAYHYYANMLATCYLLSGIIALMARWAWLKMF